MTPADIDRVFGRGRLRMVTGDHVEVFREASLPGERQRYTKRFLATAAGDFRDWTEREWRILARLVGHGIGPVPDVVQFDRGAADRPALVQTYDAGITVDHWATLLPVRRDGTLLRHVFEDCAHWWALARHCLIALNAIHELQIVHLDLKADNVCIPFDPTDFNPRAPGQLLSPRFEQIALIDFAFSLVSGESLTRALPIARQHDYDYQSPRLLQALEAGSWGDLLPTRQLDWRCDVFSLAAMLRRYLPDPEAPLEGTWTRVRHAQARALVRRLLEAHDAERPTQRPHLDLVALTAHALDDDELAASLARGWALAIDSEAASDAWPTPVTRIAMPVSVDLQAGPPAIARLDQARQGRARARRVAAAVAAASLAAIGAPLLYDAWWAAREREVADVSSAMPAPPIPGAASYRGRGCCSRRAHTRTRTRTRTPHPHLHPHSAPAIPALRAPVIAKAPAGAAVRSLHRCCQERSWVAAGTLRCQPVRRLAPECPPCHAPTDSAVPPLSERERALAWLTMRGPALWSAARSGLSAGPAVALAPAPMVAAAAPASAARTGSASGSCLRPHRCRGLHRGQCRHRCQCQRRCPNRRLYLRPRPHRCLRMRRSQCRRRCQCQRRCPNRHPYLHPRPYRCPGLPRGQCRRRRKCQRRRPNRRPYLCPRPPTLPCGPTN
jgi:hypothetical protein